MEALHDQRRTRQTCSGKSLYRLRLSVVQPDIASDALSGMTSSLPDHARVLLDLGGHTTFRPEVIDALDRVLLALTERDNRTAVVADAGSVIEPLATLCEARGVALCPSLTAGRRALVDAA